MAVLSWGLRKEQETPTNYRPRVKQRLVTSVLDAINAEGKYASLTEVTVKSLDRREIWMDERASGPIDPQVIGRDGLWLPAQLTGIAEGYSGRAPQPLSSGRHRHHTARGASLLRLQLLEPHLESVDGHRGHRKMLPPCYYPLWNQPDKPNSM